MYKDKRKILRLETFDQFSILLKLNQNTEFDQVKESGNGIVVRWLNGNLNFLRTKKILVSGKLVTSSKSEPEVEGDVEVPLS